MRQGTPVHVSPTDRSRLEAVVADRNSPQKHVWRAKVPLAAAAGHGTAAIGRRAGVSRPCVRRRRERFAREGVAGLLRGRTRKPGKAPLPAATVEWVVELTLQEPPGEATPWTGRMMAEAAGVSLRSVQRIWAAHRLAPHRVRTFKPSRDPAFCSRPNAVEALFAKLTGRRLKRGSFPSLVALREAINRYLDEHNGRPRPFVWAADPDRIVEKVARARRAAAATSAGAG